MAGAEVVIVAILTPKAEKKDRVICIGPYPRILTPLLDKISAGDLKLTELLNTIVEGVTAHESRALAYEMLVQGRFG
jgi:hypothetical protein